MLKNKKMLIGIIIGGTLIAALWAVAQSNGVETQVYTVRSSSIREVVDLRGKVELESRRTVYSEISGTVIRVPVDEGDEVKADSPLLLLDPKDMQNDLDRANLNYESAAAELNSMKNSIRPEAVKQAELQVEQAEAAVGTAQADLDYKKDKYDRFRSLAAEGGISKQDLKETELLVVAAENALRDAEQRLKIAQSNLDLQKKGVSPSDLTTAENRLREAKLQVKTAQNNLGKAFIAAGQSGTILKRYPDPGTVISPGTPLFEIGDYNSAYIRLDMLSDDAGKLRIGQKAVISGELLGKKKIIGEVYFIAPKAENTVSSLGIEEQRVEVRIKYDLSRYAFRPGYGLDVKVIVREKSPVLSVPDKAVFEKNDEDFVFIVKDNRLMLRKVDTGIEGDEAVEILRGLSAGDRIVVEPDNTLQPGMRVKPEETKE